MFYYTHMNVHDITFEIFSYLNTLLTFLNSRIIALNIYYETL
jgi:hypothetical protein